MFYAETHRRVVPKRLGLVPVVKMLLWLAIPFTFMNEGCAHNEASAHGRDEASWMQVSPKLQDAATFTGEWSVVNANAACRISLSVERIESANAYALANKDDCLSRLLGRQVVGWRPATDGNDFVGANRLSVGFFSFEGETAVLTRPEGRTTLSR